MSRDDHPRGRRRQSIRLRGYSYTQAGAYFVTICTYGRLCVFGEVEGGEVKLNALGVIAKEEWLRTGEVRASVAVEPSEFVVMPNHVHGIVRITGEPAGKVIHESEMKPIGGQRLHLGVENSGATELRVAPGSLGAILRAYKAKVARRINLLRESPGEPVWQRNYYEHIIRDEISLAQVRGYIQENPFRWEEDSLHPSKLEEWKQ